MVFASALSTIVASAAAQPAPAKPEPIFRAGTTAVVLDVVARDRRGRPIRDLRPDEITVIEDGVAREVRYFRLVEAGRAADTTAGTAPSPAAPAASPSEPTSPSHVTLISLVFDHLGQNARGLARKAALDFLAAPLPDTHLVAVFVLDQRLRLLQGFTRDTKALSAAVARATERAVKEDAPLLPGASRERATGTAYAKLADIEVSADERKAVAFETAEPRFGEVIMRMQRFATAIDTAQRGHETFYPLAVLARAHGALQGRKAILLFSEGLQVTSNVEETFRTAISEANRANVSVYAIDARGLDTSRDLQAAGAALEKAGRVSQQAISQGADAPTMDDWLNDDRVVNSLRSSTQGVLRELAESTGGALVANSNDLGKGLGRVGADLASYYEIAYVPQAGEADGRFRAVRVEVSRPGVQVSSRSGYYAVPASDRGPILPFELPLLAAATATPAPHAFDFQAAAFRFHDTPRGRQFTLVAEIPVTALAVEEDREARQYRGRVDVMAMVSDGAGAVVERFSDSYPLQGPIADLPAIRRGNVVFKRQVWLAAGRYTLTTIVRDPGPGAVSVRTLPIRVFPESPGVDISTVAVVKRVDNAGDRADAVEDPFRNGPMRIVPSIATTISKAANSEISAFVVLYPDATMTDPASLTIEFAQGSTVIGRSSPALDKPDEHGRITCVATFPAETFAAGTYELRAIARQGASQDETRTTFTVVQ